MTGQRIGFIGLGAMGEGQSKNLIKAGFAVRGYDVNSGAVERLVEAGGERAESPADAARDSGLLIILVFSAAHAEAVLFNSDGAVSALPKGATVVLHTTGKPEDAVRFEARLAESGHLMVDAPVTGGKAGADTGTLTVIASGSDEAFAAAERAFKAMSKTIYRIGDKAGAASTVKMISQLLVGVHGVVMAEALALATRAGADLKVVYDVITHGVGNSVVFERFVPFVLARDFEPRGATELLIKDLGIVLDAGRELSLPLPLAAVALQQYLAAAAQGYARADFTSVVKVYERLANIELTQAAQKSG